ncbi:unnamed protein product [Prunus armeniaca]
MEYTNGAFIADILREERQVGHKGDGGWKAVAYNIDVALLSAQFDIKSHEDARTFRFKVIANWDDIVDLCGKYKATGEGAETCAEAVEIMTPESDPNNIVDLESDTQGFESY